MIKSFKKGLALVLAAAMVFSTPIAVNTTKADAAETLTSSEWWSFAGNSQNYTMSGKNATFEFGIRADALVNNYGAFSVELIATLGQNDEGQDLLGYITTGSDGNCWFAEEFEGQGTVEGVRDSIDSVLTEGEVYTVKVTRDDHKFDIEYIDANKEETVDHFTATLNDDVTIPDDVTIHFMAQIGTYTVTPYAVPVNKKSINGVGWWNAANTASDVYYVEPNSSAEIYVANTDGNTGLILESVTDEGYITANLAVTNDETGALDVWGDALNASGNFIVPAEGTTYSFPAKGIIKISIERDGQKLTVTLTDVATDVVVASGEGTLVCPEDELLGFYVKAQDGSFDVGPTLGTVASLISDLKAAVSEDGTKIQLTAQQDREFDDIYVNVNDEKDELNDVNVATSGAISYEYAPEESGDYKFDMVAEKAGFAKDVESASMGVVVEDGKIVLDTELASDFAAVKGVSSYGFTAKKLLEDVTYTIEVSESGKVIATLKEEETLEFSKLTSGKEYTAKLIAKKDGYAAKTYTTKFTYTAEEREDAEAGATRTDINKTLGKIDYSSGFWSEFSTYKIEDNKKYTFVFENHSSGSNNWNNFVLAFANQADFGNDTRGDAYTEYAVVRADNYSWVATSEGNIANTTLSGKAVTFTNSITDPAAGSDDSWAEWKNIIKDSDVTMDVIRSGSEVKVEATIVSQTDKTKKIDWTASLNCANADGSDPNPLYMGFTVDGCYLNLKYVDEQESKVELPKSDDSTETPTDATGGTAKTIVFTDWTAKYGAKKVTGELSIKGANVTVKVGKKAAVKATVSGKKFTAKVAKLTKGTKVVITASKDGYATVKKTITVKAPMKVKSVKAKKGTKKVTGTISVKGATVKVKVGKKAYKKAKVKGKKFTLKVAKLKKGTKIKVQATKKNYKTATKSVKVK